METQIFRMDDPGRVFSWLKKKKRRFQLVEEETRGSFE